MKLKKIKDFYCISIRELEELGFPLPPIGTVVYFFESQFIDYKFDIIGEYDWSRLSGYKEGWDTIEVSPYCNHIGKKNKGKGELYVPFNPNTFQILPDKLYEEYKLKKALK